MSPVPALDLGGASVELAAQFLVGAVFALEWVGVTDSAHGVRSTSRLAPGSWSIREGPRASCCCAPMQR